MRVRSKLVFECDRCDAEFEADTVLEVSEDGQLVISRFGSVEPPEGWACVEEQSALLYGFDRSYRKLLGFSPGATFVCPSCLENINLTK